MTTASGDHSPRTWVQGMDSFIFDGAALVTGFHSINFVPVQKPTAQPAPNTKKR